MYEAGAAIDSGLDDAIYLGGSNYTCHDAIAQIGIPEFEFPRSDFPRGFRFAGIVPPSIPTAVPEFPWWNKLILNSQRRLEERARVVVVAQGTVEMDPAQLILPTLRLLANRQDVLTVAILGSRSARLPEGIKLPHNACIANYLPYDAVLPLADLWVHNGGYGATMHGIAHGVPMVIAGDGQDKPENGKRVQYSGLGIDLATAHPNAEQLGIAINAVLSGEAFSKVARSMQRTFRQMDCFTNIEEIINNEIACSA
ncbi:glycosyl transferase family protein [Grosmannia clavigera kw1407]|uniref:Glycosyl transferase family protein n=1 Tax=Grosmannia clavigera (strain kw1407 / UAMH 11150) TaxID=655863 RepID=F0XNV4_GROCL|nr:glycosyl transferase family protein [Grosmannia clavigera kw1407]EFX00246.1 glycosyl transferase family protein [Grosmannia clavigera kw1407]